MKILIIILVIALSGTTALAAERPNRDGLGRDLDYSNLGDTNSNSTELDSPSALVDESSANTEDLETKTLTAYGEPSRGSNSSKGGGTR